MANAKYFRNRNEYCAKWVWCVTYIKRQLRLWTGKIIFLKLNNYFIKCLSSNLTNHSHDKYFRVRFSSWKSTFDLRLRRPLRRMHEIYRTSSFTAANVLHSSNEIVSRKYDMHLSLMSLVISRMQLNTNEQHALSWCIFHGRLGFVFHLLYWYIC